MMMTRVPTSRGATRAALLILGLAAAPTIASAQPAPPVVTLPEEQELRAPPDAIATAGGELLIQPIYHASLMLSWNGVNILFDPAQGPRRLAGLPVPDLILITDIHGDHLDVPSITVALSNTTAIIAPQAVYDRLPRSIQAVTTVMANGAAVEFSGVTIEAVPMYNLALVPFHDQGRGNGYLLDFAGTRVYVAGDTDETPEMDALRDVDIAFLPMSPPFTMDVEEAAHAALTFAPAMVYPYHYGDRGTFFDIAAFALAVAAENPAIEVRLRDWYPE